MRTMRIPVISNLRGLAFLMLFPTSLTMSHAQRQWTLDECISYAIDHNINIQQRELDIKKNQVKLETSSNAWLPEVSARLGEQFSFGNYNSTTGSLTSPTVAENNDLAYTTGGVTATMNTAFRSMLLLPTSRKPVRTSAFRLPFVTWSASATKAWSMWPFHSWKSARSCANEPQRSSKTANVHSAS